MSIAAANVKPDLILNPRIEADDLKRLEQPLVYPEYHGFDGDGVEFYVFTIGGWLDGRHVERCTVGGDGIIVNADSQVNANYMAILGLEDTINFLNTEENIRLDALAAQARLKTVGAIDRLTLAAKPDSEKSDQFEQDIAKLTVLRGDDIILASGH